jgi:hypothetical protein
VVLFVLAAFVLGLVTKCYRDAHPSPAPTHSDLGRAPPPVSAEATAGKPGAPPRERVRESRRTQKVTSPEPALEQEQK